MKESLTKDDFEEAVRALKEASVSGRKLAITSDGLWYLDEENGWMPFNHTEKPVDAFCTPQATHVADYA